MPARQQRGVQSRRPSLGLSKFFNSGIEGGEFIEPEILAEPQGPSLSGSPLPPVYSKPRFEDYRVKSPFIDMLGGGQASSMATQLNAANRLSQADMYSRSNIAEMNNRAAFEQQQMGDMNQSARDIQLFKAQKEQAELGHNLGLAAKEGVSSEGMSSLFSKTNPLKIGYASNLAQARLKGSNTPEFNTAAQNEVIAERQVLPISLRSKGAINVGPGDMTQVPGVGLQDGGYPNQVMFGSGESQELNMVGGITDPETGQVFGAKPQVTSKTTPGNIVNTDAIANKEQLIREAIEKKRVETGLLATDKPPMVRSRSTSESSPNTALIPQLLETLNQRLLEPYTSGMKDLLYDAPKQTLFDSRHERPYLKSKKPKVNY